MLARLKTASVPCSTDSFWNSCTRASKEDEHAELIRNRSYEEPSNTIGLSRNWERYPDDRNDDYALTFHWDDQFAYPQQRKIKDP